MDPAELELALADLAIALSILDGLVSTATLQALAEEARGRLSEETTGALAAEMPASQERLA